MKERKKKTRKTPAEVRDLEPQANPRGGFFAYDTSFIGGVRVATGDVNNDNVVAPQPKKITN